MTFSIRSSSSKFMCILIGEVAATLEHTAFLKVRKVGVKKRHKVTCREECVLGPEEALCCVVWGALLFPSEQSILG